MQQVKLVMADTDGKGRSELQEVVVATSDRCFANMAGDPLAGLPADVTRSMESARTAAHQSTSMEVRLGKICRSIRYSRRASTASTAESLVSQTPDPLIDVDALHRPSDIG